jgi:hypothetical protein
MRKDTTIKYTKRKTRQRINPVSKRRKKEKPEYIKISNELKEKAGYKSELSGKTPTEFDWLECHHINGRTGKDYIDPYNLLVCLHSEHQTDKDSIHKHNSYEKKLELLAMVKIIREEQGYERS